ncbi:MAG: hypothetical protein EX271_09280 [Acidimicrobiales bacterium]|nr:hypothetical protein [Hyphomonadaceae bacterium]RZV40870.1 MAG: hypothetical protein EX271_09280 [Acidimicrobiales bacterium]
MFSKILKAMTEAISVLSTLEKTYIACCVALVITDYLGGFTPDMFKFGFTVLIGALAPVLVLAKKTQKNISALLAAMLMVCIYSLGKGYLTG